MSIYKNQLEIDVTVLLNPKAPHYKEIREFSLNNESWLTHIDFVDNMAKLMSKSSIAIGAPGSTSWERACLGIPSIIIPLAENQRDIANNLEIAKAAIKVELVEIESNLFNAIQELINSWQAYYETNISLCDGLGRERVLQEIQKLF